MTKKLNKQEILEIISAPDCYVRYLPNPYLEPKKVLICDKPDKNKVLELSTTYIFKHKLLEMTLIYENKSVSRIMRPDAKWHRPVVRDMLEIQKKIVEKYENEQHQK